MSVTIPLMALQVWLCLSSSLWEFLKGLKTKFTLFHIIFSCSEKKKKKGFHSTTVQVLWNLTLHHKPCVLLFPCKRTEPVAASWEATEITVPRQVSCSLHVSFKTWSMSPKKFYDIAVPENHLNIDPYQDYCRSFILSVKMVMRISKLFSVCILGV